MEVDQEGENNISPPRAVGNKNALGKDADEQGGEGKPRKLRCSKKIKLDLERLAAENGFNEVWHRFAPTFKSTYQGPGAEVADLRRLLELYERWGGRVDPSCDFDSFVLRLEKLSKQSALKHKLNDMRQKLLGLVIPPEGEEQQQQAVAAGAAAAAAAGAGPGGGAMGAGTAAAAAHMHADEDGYGADDLPDDDELVALQAQDEWDAGYDVMDEMEAQAEHAVTVGGVVAGAEAAAGRLGGPELAGAPSPAIAGMRTDDAQLHQQAHDERAMDLDNGVERGDEDEEDEVERAIRRTAREQESERRQLEEEEARLRRQQQQHAEQGGGEGHGAASWGEDLLVDEHQGGLQDGAPPADAAAAAAATAAGPGTGDAADGADEALMALVDADPDELQEGAAAAAEDTVLGALLQPPPQQPQERPGAQPATTGPAGAGADDDDMQDVNAAEGLPPGNGTGDASGPGGGAAIWGVLASADEGIAVAADEGGNGATAGEHERVLEGGDEDGSDHATLDGELMALAEADTDTLTGALLGSRSGRSSVQATAAAGELGSLAVGAVGQQARAEAGSRAEGALAAMDACGEPETTGADAAEVPELDEELLALANADLAGV